MSSYLYKFIRNLFHTICWKYKYYEKCEILYGIMYTKFIKFDNEDEHLNNEMTFSYSILQFSFRNIRQIFV